MKKTVLLVFMSVLFIVGLTSMLNMDPAPNSECSEICTSEVEDFLGISHGDCMSLCNTCVNPGKGKGVEAVCFCKTIDAVVGLDNLGVNMGQCVTEVKGGN